jgi:hypothetical protein
LHAGFAHLGDETDGRRNGIEYEPDDRALLDPRRSALVALMGLNFF